MSASGNYRSHNPPVRWLFKYERRWLGADIVAGLISATVVIPKAMGFATIAGLPVQVGLYSSLVPMVVYALLGTSRPLSVSTTTTISILTAAELSEVVPNGDPAHAIAAAATLAVSAGVILVIASLLRLGFVANFISDPVLTGFKAAIGVVIIVDQVPKLLGLHVAKSGFLADVASIVRHLSEASLATVAITCATLVLMLLLHRQLPRIPAPLAAVAMGIAISVALPMSAIGVATLGSIPRGLPQWTWPDLRLVSAMWPGAAAIALMSFTESIAAARAFTVADEPRPSPNRELLALGAANLLGGLCSSMPAGGGATQTSVNRSAGARTQCAELVTAAITLATLVVLAPLIALLPAATLACVVMAASVGLIKPAEFKEIARVRNTEFCWALVAFAGVLLLGTLRGIVVAVITSLLALAQQAYSPSVYAIGRERGGHVFQPLSAAQTNNANWPGLLMVRIEGRLFFANAQRVGDKLWPLIQSAQPSVIVIDCSSIVDIEYTALKMLADAKAKLKRDGVSLWLAALNPNVAVMVSRLAESDKHRWIFPSVEAALARFEQVGSEQKVQTIAPAA